MRCSTTGGTCIKLCILDEGTGSLDTETDDAVHAAVLGLVGCTVVSVTHRLHHLAEFDLVMVMRDGVIAQLGRPEQLLSQSDGPLADLLSASPQ